MAKEQTHCENRSKTKRKLHKKRPARNKKTGRIRPVWNLGGIFMNDKPSQGDILIYQNEKGDTKVDVYYINDTVWMT